MDFETLINEHTVTASDQTLDSSKSNITISSEEEVDFIPSLTSPKTKKFNILKQLNTTLSPKYTAIEPSDGRVSKYGRLQKSKELEEGFVPTELTRFISKSRTKSDYKLVTEENFRIVKTPTKIYSVDQIEDDNLIDENGEKYEPINIDYSTTFDDLRNEKPIEISQHNSPIKTKTPQPTLDLIDQLSDTDADSGRGSSIGPDSILTNFKEGEIFWAEYKSKNWWPCITGPDPDGNLIQTGKFKYPQIHIYYLADLRSWIQVNKLVPYKSFDELKTTHKVKIDKKKKSFDRAVQLADLYTKISIEKRLERLEIDAEHDREQERQQKLAKRLSKEQVNPILDRSLTPESPAFEDTTTDIHIVQSELNHARELALKTRKRASTSIREVENVKKGRYSARVIDLKNKKSFSPSQSPVIKKEIPKPVKVTVKKEPESNESLEDRLKREFITVGFNHTHLYPINSIRKEPVCRLCLIPKNVIKCKTCLGHYHFECILKQKSGEPIPVLKRGPIGKKIKKNAKKSRISTMDIPEIKTEIVQVNDPNVQDIPDEFTCEDCRTNANKTCFICKVKQEDELTYQCNYRTCTRFYHKSCINDMPQCSNMTDGTFTCAYHKCHTCFALDASSVTDDSKLVSCVICPTSYHFNDVNCIPAGTEFLTSTKIICTNHAINPPSTNVNVNVNWCFVCTKGGKLICCDSCPGAFHLECVKEKEPPTDKYFCDNCKAGRKILYNEVCWAKMGHFRYWPGIALPPMVIPLDILDIFHYPNDICIKFFGSNDCAWISRERIFAYEEEDYMSKQDTSTTGLAKAFNKALIEAKTAHRLLKADKEESQRTTFNKSKPEHYKKLFTNKAVPPAKLETSDPHIMNECSCKPTDPDPCGYTSQCLNRSSKQECNPNTCPAKENCKNQMFTKRAYPKLIEKNTYNKGWGLFADQNIQAGTFIIEYIGEVINRAEMDRRMELAELKKENNYYFMDLGSGQVIDAGQKGNLARFINHSCMPNCVTEMWQIGKTRRIGIFAMEDIKKGDELSFDYQLQCKGDAKKECKCGAPNCRGYIGPRIKDYRRNSVISSRSSTPVEKNKGKAQKRKRPVKIKLKSNKKQKTNSSLPNNSQEDDTKNSSITIEDDIEVKSKNYVPEDNGGD
uniref:CSON003379 protein n=1 Tax=Culicoides sonorensis TaxID=179676 RepID=A0A336ML71_CULSO